MSSSSPPASVELPPVFNPPTYEQWVESALAGLGSDKSLDDLQNRTLDGLTIRVLYDDILGVTASEDPDILTDAEPRSMLPAGMWDNRLCVQDTRDATLANAQVQEGLRGGNTSVELPVSRHTDLGVLLDSVDLQIAPVSLRAGADYAESAQQFTTLATRQGIDLSALHCSFNADPLGYALHSGNGLQTLDAAVASMAAFAVSIGESLPCASAVLVDVAQHHNAGASARQELQAAIATATLYLDALLDAGMSVQQANDRLVFQVALDTDVLMGIVKLRSLARLWQHVLRHADRAEHRAVDANLPRSESAGRPRVVAETSRRFLSRLEPWNNHLRNIAACSAAAMASAGTIIVHPHDSANTGQGADDPSLGRRMARNLPIILERESGLTLIHDPLAGSYAVESLTNELTTLTWQALSDMGDTSAWQHSISTGQWQSQLADTHTQRLALMHQERRIVVGVNRYALPAGSPRADSEGHAEAATRTMPADTLALYPVRDAESFETPTDETVGVSG